MSALHGISPALLALVPLAVAAGVDLYLTLLFLGVAPSTPWWGHPLPGALADLHSMGVLVMVGLFYVLEVTAERWLPSAVFWNALHALIRPLAGALLALLVLEGQPEAIVLAGAAVSAVLTSAVHTVRSGGRTLLWLSGGSVPRPAVVSAAEDVAVVGLLALTLDRPTWAAGLSALLLLGALPIARSQARAFAFAARLGWGRVWRVLGRGGWRSPREIPGWVGEVLASDSVVSGAPLRGAPGAAYRLPGSPRFAVGWVVVRAEGPVFVFRVWGRVGLVPLGALGALSVAEGAFFRRVDLGAAGHQVSNIFFGVDGPGAEGLRGEFLSR